MARRPQLTTAQDAEFIDAHAEDVTEQEEAALSEEQMIAAEMAEAEGDAQIHFTVHKIIPESRDLPWCMEGTAADLPITLKLQQRFGAGKYRITIYRDKKYKKRLTLSVLAPNTDTPAPQVVQQTNPANDPRLISLLERVVAQTQTPAPQRPPISAQDIIAMIAAAAPVLTTLKELFAQPKQENQMQTFMEAMRLGAELSGDGGREPSILETVGKMLTNPQLLETFSNVTGNAQQTQPRALPAPRQPQTPTPEQIQQAQMAQIQQQLQFLITRAQKNSEPGLYAEMIIDTYDEALIRQLAQPGAIEFLQQLHPPIATYRPWFEALLTSLVDQLNQNEPGQDEALPGATPRAHPSQQGASPVSEQSPAERVVFDPFGGVGNESDTPINGPPLTDGEEEFRST